jgi:cyanophycin synthetase
MTINRSGKKIAISASMPFMKITSAHHHRGANVYSLHSVLVLQFSGFSSADMDAAALRQTLCTAPFDFGLEPDDPLWPRSLGPELVPPVAMIARVAAWLQMRAGILVDYYAAPAGLDGQPYAIFGCEDKQVGVKVGQCAATLVAWFLASPRPSDQRLAQYTKDLLTWSARSALNFYSLPMILAAQQRNIPWSRVTKTPYLRLGSGSRQQVILETGTAANNWIAFVSSNDKSQTHALLAAQNLPVAQQLAVRSADKAAQAAQQIGFPVVVKPLNMKQGIGVHLNLQNVGAVRTAFTAAQRYSRTVLVEQQIAGNDYRMLVVGGELVAAAWRRPPHVTGDGAATITKLIDRLNRDPLRADNNQAPLKKIMIDDNVTGYLAQQGFGLDDVVAKDQRVMLRNLPNIAVGGEPLDVLDQVHPENRQVALDGAATLGVAVAGVDFICPDISRSYSEFGGVICEINTVPGLDVHFNAPGGTVRVAGKIIDLIYPDAVKARIPVVVAPNQDEFVHSLAAACQTRDYRVGTWVDGHSEISKLPTGLAASMGIEELLQSPLVDIACLAPKAAQLVAAGLGFDRATWAVFLHEVTDSESAVLLATYCDTIILGQGVEWPEGLAVGNKVVQIPINHEPVAWMLNQIDGLM